MGFTIGTDAESRNRAEVRVDNGWSSGRCWRELEGEVKILRTENNTVRQERNHNDNIM